MQKLKHTTADSVRQYAIDWQNWQTTQSLSFSEMMEWCEYFHELADEWQLTDEFKENGII